METLHFPGRDVPPYGEYASAASLVEGRVYYRLDYLDEQMTIPDMQPFIFIGRNLDEGDEDYLYFQDAESYLDGVRYGDTTGKDSEIEGEVHRVSSGTPFIYEFEKALDRLLYLSLERKGS
jgi:hypothetical protein